MTIIRMLVNMTPDPWSIESETGTKLLSGLVYNLFQTATIVAIFYKQFNKLANLYQTERTDHVLYFCIAICCPLQTEVYPVQKPH